MELAWVDVLIVDDDRAIRVMLRRALRRFGIICREAADGLDALAYLQTADCAVILLDMMMPRLDGYGFTKRFSEIRKEHQHPVVLAISDSAIEPVTFSSDDPIHAIVPKPFDVNELAEIVALCAAARRPELEKTVLRAP